MTIISIALRPFSKGLKFIRLGFIIESLELKVKAYVGTPFFGNSRNVTTFLSLD